ncbi:helix-turn-helix domain-containing protein [Clostridium perfringens]|uniref:helix-turn-helix domain-containing protein n=1 Tax=Clostridium perfringens TaxID=1502 RepID=UPI0013E339A7|nr:helix-turn-helix domain-containing protein [Clostridium perfringens]NGT54759.1 helix-turn-helix domain-containing protein [Clostridium perfringens]
MDQIKYEGKSILCKGYGTIPKFIMQAKISIEAKAIYAYMCSFAGAGQSAFPSVEKILVDLNISKDRFYKHRKELINNGFIKIERNRIKGKVMKNTYIIPQIVMSSEEKKPFPQNKETDTKPIPCFKDTRNKDTRNKDTRNKDSNNNKTNNNKTNNNNINNNNTDVVVDKDFQKVLKGFDESDIKLILKFCFENHIDIEVVEEKLKIINGMKKVYNRVGALITAIKEDWKPNRGQVNNNCNFSQRDYDYDSLEKQLLGWEE